MIAGTASVDDAAAAADCDPEQLAGGAAAIGRLTLEQPTGASGRRVRRGRGGRVRPSVRAPCASAARESASMSSAIHRSAFSSARKNAWPAAKAGGPGASSISVRAEDRGQRVEQAAATVGRDRARRARSA